MSVVIGVLTMAEGLASGQAAPPSSVSALSWMAGSWGATIDGVEMEEHWTTAKGGTLVGMHRDVAKGRTVSFEFLRVEEQNGGLVYLASPRGAPPTPFPSGRSRRHSRGVRQSAARLPAANHLLEGRRGLEARIEGPQGGKTVGEEWKWAPLGR